MMKTFQDLVAEAKKQIREISPEEVATKQRAGEKFILIDVRELEDYQEAHLPFAVNMPRGFLEAEIARHEAGPDTAIVCQCGGGSRSALAAKTLQEMGFRNVASMAGGLKAWKEKGLPVEGAKK